MALVCIYLDLEVSLCWFLQDAEELYAQFEPCAMSGRGVARPGPCGGRGGMSWQLPVIVVGPALLPRWGCSGQRRPPTATLLFELHAGDLC